VQVIRRFLPETFSSRVQTVLTAQATDSFIRRLLKQLTHETDQSINQSKLISIAPYVASESDAHDDGN